MPKITLLYIDSGGGHRAAANALVESIRMQRRPWKIEMVSIQDIFDSVDFIRQFTGIRFQDVYNIMLRRGWTLGSAQMIRLMHSIISKSHPAQVTAMRRHWMKARPEMVVSLIPHFNRAIKEALDGVWPGTPYVTLLTDIADHPPHFWIEKLDQHVICGSTLAATQAREIGIAPDRILRTSGMILHPRFYESMEMDRAAERSRLGLKPDVPTGLVLFGGEGSNEMVDIARALGRSKTPVQLIMVCGKNEKVAAQLRGMSTVPMFVEGFTRDIPYYMELADFFVGKPGPGSISEALAKRLPVIVRRNAWTMAHERYNADWIETEGLGVVVSNFANDIAQAIETLLSPASNSAMQSRISGLRNEAVFEIPVMLARILEERNYVSPKPEIAGAVCA